ncbi:hypothetical protein C479_14213 [Halovivax asiaticus JCM 14624]|uniref:Uncharacterized protein n=1 Tax=Halovivax asiaticus JCM 14624 TaxID=1227490 RepID=M0BCH0_9EURY|nr:hypothetical protein [Halovivax asiaticus]ELZ08500.1 hypothetical protein C479_14213 [Halovivax asiaticus JCM 14624]
MTRTIEALVTDAVEFDDLDRYAIPSETYDGVEPDEDLVLVQTDPFPERVRRILGLPIVNIPLRVVGMFVLAIPVIGPKWADLWDQGTYKVAIEHGAVDIGEWISLELEEAVVEETTSRRGTEDRTIWLYEGEVRTRGDHS